MSEEELDDLSMPEEIGETDSQDEMYEHFSVTVDKGQGMLRIDKFLTNRMEGVSRNRIQAAADAGNILVGGTPVKSSYKVKPLDRISIVMPYPLRELEIVPENIPLDIRYEDDDLIIVNPHIQHTEISLSASPLSYYTVGVDGISFSFHDQKEFQIFHCHQKHADLLFYFHSLFQELDEKNDGYEEICKHTLAILISQLRRFAVSDFQLFPSFHPSKECALVKRYLDSHYSDDINLEQLASLSHLNKYYLSHEFTRYYGISPISYLTHRRIEVCKNLLENTDHEISDIAHLAGFSSQSYLAQSFRKYCGMTAGEYRRSKKNQTI